MADLTPSERLLPSLLDRLTDSEPRRTEESRDQRVGTQYTLRQSVLRDLEWLMNTINLESVVDLERWPELRETVINFGLPGLSGNTLNNEDRKAIQKLIKATIQAFEPRILRNTVSVTLIEGAESDNRHAIAFQIEGTLWGNPLPEALFLRTELDLELGEVKVLEA